MSLSRRRQANPHLGAYYGILTSAFVSLVISLALFEQLGWQEMWVARAMILVPLALYLALALGARTVNVEDFFASGRARSMSRIFSFPGGGCLQSITARCCRRC